MHVYGRSSPTPALANAKLVRTYARKVRSAARWSRATEPVFSSISDGSTRRHTFFADLATLPVRLESVSEDESRSPSLFGLVFLLRVVDWLFRAPSSTADEELDCGVWVPFNDGSRVTCATSTSFLDVLAMLP